LEKYGQTYAKTEISAGEKKFPGEIFTGYNKTS
jgi:hypothetical protein